MQKCLVILPHHVKAPPHHNIYNHDYCVKLKLIGKLSYCPIFSVTLQHLFAETAKTTTCVGITMHVSAVETGTHLHIYKMSLVWFALPSYSNTGCHVQQSKHFFYVPSQTRVEFHSMLMGVTCSILMGVTCDTHGVTCMMHMTCSILTGMIH